MDRLFGKEISNVIDPSIDNKTKQLLGRTQFQLTRSTSQNTTKITGKRFNRSGNTQNPSQKCKKGPTTISQPLLINTDIQYLQDHFEDCFKFMMNQQAKNYRLSNYMHQQPQINQKMRAILLDWLIDLHHKFKMFPQTLYITIMVIDKYLAKKHANKQNLQLIGIAALYLSAKYEQIHQVPELDQLIQLTARAFNKQQIIKMEADIVVTLEFNLIMETSFKFMEPLAMICNMDQKNFRLVQYLLEMSLLETGFLECRPSLVASSSIYLINKINKRSQVWPRALELLTGYSEKELKNWARQLYCLLEKADQLPNTRALKKKFSLPQYHQVTKIKIQRRKY